MTRLHRLRYVQAFVDRDTGAVFRYFRRPGYPRVPLPGLPWSPTFMAALEAASMAMPEPIGAKRSKPGSVAAVVAGYYTSLNFRALAPSTQEARRIILERFRSEHGDKPIGLMPPKFLKVVLATKGQFAATNWLKAIRALCQFAVEQEMLREDPTLGIKLPRVKSDGHHTWTEEEIAQFEAAHPIGSKARLALALLLYTAQRRGDVIRMGRQHVRDGVLHVRQDKTGATLAIPIHPVLRAVLDATANNNLTFLVGASGKPFAGPRFSYWFREQCDAAGLPKACSAHGLRKAACRRLAEAGCSANEIAAISGHASLREVERYTKAVDQEKMARNALDRLRTTIEPQSVKLNNV